MCVTNDGVPTACIHHILVLNVTQASPAEPAKANTTHCSIKTDHQVSISNNLMATSSSELDQTTEKPPTIASIPTAVVNAINGCRNRRVRITLDTGATISTITESLASHLKLKCLPQQTTISGTGGDEVSRSFVKVQLQSIHDSTKVREFTLSVLSKLPPIQPPLRKKELAEDPNVKGLQLADPDFGGSLDVLVSSTLASVYKETLNTMIHLTCCSSLPSLDGQ